MEAEAKAGRQVDAYATTAAEAETEVVAEGEVATAVEGETGEEARNRLRRGVFVDIVVAVVFDVLFVVGVFVALCVVFGDAVFIVAFGLGDGGVDVVGGGGKGRE